MIPNSNILGWTPSSDSFYKRHHNGITASTILLGVCHEDLSCTKRKSKKSKTNIKIRFGSFWAISFQLLSCCRTDLLSPPLKGCPQVTTTPSARTAAKAPLEACSSKTSKSWSRTCETTRDVNKQPTFKKPNIQVI